VDQAQLERITVALEKLGDAQARLAVREVTPEGQYSREELEERARIKLKNSLDLALEYHRATVAFGQTAIRMALIFNGTGILIIMNFVSNAVRAGVGIAGGTTSALSVALTLYIIGAALALIASVFGYFGNMHGTRVRAFEPLGALFKLHPKGYREIGLPRAVLQKGGVKEYVTGQHQAATLFQLWIVLAAFGAYALFSIATVVAHGALIGAIQSV